MKDNTISNINIGGDSSYGIQLEEIKDKSPPPKSRKKLFIIIGIVVGVIVITTIVLLAVLLTKEDKKNHKLTNNNGSNKQSIELLIEGIQDSSQGRNLQENQKVQIFGETFEGLSSSNANIYFNGQKIAFNKSLNILNNSLLDLIIFFIFADFTSFKGLSIFLTFIIISGFFLVESKLLLIKS